MSTADPIVIVGAKRTPMGAFQGELASLNAPQLGARAIEAALSDADVGVDDVDEVLMGCVLPAGQGQAPARQAAIGAGIPMSTGCTTINKMCGSGMKWKFSGAETVLTLRSKTLTKGAWEIFWAQVAKFGL